MKGKGQRAKGKSYGAVIGTLLVLLALPAAASAQQMIVFVRHAERADGGAGAGSMTSPTPADPLLSAAGQSRATKLAGMLADAGVKAIYATEFHRTQDTGKPLAAKLGITVQSIPANDVNALVAAIKKDHARDVVLVIGHSNTVPNVIKAFGGPTITMRDDEYDALYVLQPATGAWTLIRY